MQQKKGGPKMKVYAEKLMKTKDKFSTASTEPVMLLKNKALIGLNPRSYRK